MGSQILSIGAGQVVVEQLREHTMAVRELATARAGRRDMFPELNGIVSTRTA